MARNKITIEVKINGKTKEGIKLKRDIKKGISKARRAFKRGF